MISDTGVSEAVADVSSHLEPARWTTPLCEPVKRVVKCGRLVNGLAGVAAARFTQG